MANKSYSISPYTMLVLSGLQCTGKSSVGKLLALATGFDFIDTDNEIMREEKMNIDDIVKKNGFPYFRLCENSMAHCVTGPALKKPLVVATGGGMFSNTQAPQYCLENRELFKKEGIILYLQPSPNPEEYIPLLARRKQRHQKSQSTRPLQPGMESLDDVKMFQKWYDDRHADLAALADVYVYAGIDNSQRKVAFGILENLPRIIENKQRGTRSSVSI